MDQEYSQYLNWSARVLRYGVFAQLVLFGFKKKGIVFGTVLHDQ